MRWQHVPILILLLALLVIPGAAAGAKYLYGNPELSATIAGTNEFAPGADTSLTVIISNSGLYTHKIVGSDIINRDDLPNTAKLVTAALKSEDAPFTIKTDPQFVSDIPGGTARDATFNVKVADSAKPGTYTLPLEVTYTYLREAEEYGSDTLRYYYQKKTEVLPLTVRVTPDLRIEVLDVRSESLNVGTEGYVYMTLKNIGHDTGNKAVAKVVRNGASPLIPTDSSAYIGTFRPGETVDVKFKVSVSDNAEPQSYPLDVVVTYEDYEEKTVTTKAVTIGLPTGGKIDFDVVSPPATLYPGGKSILEVVYKNTGAAKVYNAQARISAVDPFTSNDDTAYLGDLAPGETATARFEVSIDSDATLKEYGIDSEIRYRDDLDNSKISDTMKVRVILEKKPGALFTNPIFLTIVVVIIAGAAYYILVHRKKE
ncbi:MAG TPA: CARDB domain-containing protein [Candidatus Methanoculleus thermohydrogenotrophicum]|nr:S-layer protein [Candidatus Methanoculleus thermohydrogenotrophicum]HOB18534.1 CARDB domain-containing protein [Candidatus Methanoculleus thermohydrogenotrophicum]HPZ38663.1 CARDB domain-containing protein [Candidatus Methanoculleus thermohydrogenotrophicum]HQC91826.1 CARDB domain-containing protein [Candidatus Methanoculleus thermohydrogenotrophicum]